MRPPHRMQLFPKEQCPRRKPVKRMHVVDAGHLPDGCNGISFACPHCGYETGWIEDDLTVSQNKRGLPCPECNGREEDHA